MSTITITIRTYIRRQYSRDTQGHLGYRDTQRWTADALPHWLGPDEAPLMWEGEYVGTAGDLEVSDFLEPLYRRHYRDVPQDCNHVSVQQHQIAADDLPDSLRHLAESQTD